jgi:hypothetical protein
MPNKRVSNCLDLANEMNRQLVTGDNGGADNVAAALHALKPEESNYIVAMLAKRALQLDGGWGQFITMLESRVARMH